MLQGDFFQCLSVQSKRHGVGCICERICLLCFTYTIVLTLFVTYLLSQHKIYISVVYSIFDCCLFFASFENDSFRLWYGDEFLRSFS